MIWKPLQKHFPYHHFDLLSKMLFVRCYLLHLFSTKWITNHNRRPASTRCQHSTYSRGTERILGVHFVATDDRALPLTVSKGRNKLLHICQERWNIYTIFIWSVRDSIYPYAFKFINHSQHQIRDFPITSPSAPKVTFLLKGTAFSRKWWPGGACKSSIRVNPFFLVIAKVEVRIMNTACK